MRRFLVCSGVHGRIESLEWLHKAVRQRRPDGVLFAGGVLDRERTYAPTSTTCWGHTRSDTFFLKGFFDSLGGLGVFTAIIPGALDAPLDFDEETYERAYYLADNYYQRVEQLDLVRTALYNVFRTANKPFIQLTLERTSGFAERVGMAEIHRFLRKGHEAIQSVRDIYRFVETVYVREKERLDRIYNM